MVDSSLAGLARGAGITPTENMLCFLKNPKFKLRPVLEVIQSHVQALADGLGQASPFASESNGFEQPFDWPRLPNKSVGTRGPVAGPAFGSHTTKKPKGLYAHTSRDPWALTREALLGPKQLQD